MLSKKVAHLYKQLNACSKGDTFIMIDTTNIADPHEYIKIQCQKLDLLNPYIYAWNDTIQDLNVEQRDNIVFFITVSENDCSSINKLHNKGRHKGSLYKIEAQIICVWRFLNRNSSIFNNYTDMWYVEYDVYCHGDIKVVLDKCNCVNADLLVKGSDKSNIIRTKQTEPRWVWWNNLEGDIVKVDNMEQRGCFLPILRMSSKFLKCLEDNLGKSSGFCEAYFPTLCHVNNMILNVIPNDVLSTFNYRANLNIDVISKMKEQNILFHPLKKI
jgi:hypothetical protein